ncbi:hypothetical protein [Streptomyces thermolilacinus]|uniref:hypothetical protein n=1 Tax=Streptomyces thermolilacinus TaxID=285540 RepID=UPI0033FB74D2
MTLLRAPAVGLLLGGVGALLARSRMRKGGASRAYDIGLGAPLLAAGVLAVPRAQAVLAWPDTEPAPGGVGDRDGEVSIALLATLSGGTMILVGMALLAYAVRTRTRPGTRAGGGHRSGSDRAHT